MINKFIATLALAFAFAPQANASNLPSGIYIPDQDNCRFKIIAAPDGRTIVKQVEANWSRIIRGVIHYYYCPANGAILRYNSDGTYSGKLRYKERRFTHIVVYPFNSRDIAIARRTAEESLTPEKMIDLVSSGAIPLYTRKIN